MNTPSIFAENALVLAHDALPASQYLLRLQTPKCAKSVQPGNFIHLSCSHEKYSLKRPFSVLRSSINEGWIEVLYKIVGTGTKQLSEINVGDTLHCLGPIGNAFTPSAHCKRPLLLGGGVGIPPILFFAEQLKKHNDITPMVMMGSEIPFPFKVQPSKILIDAMPDDTIASMSLLEDLSIPSRLTSKQNYSGCFDGYLHELATIWLESLNEKERAETEIFACGPTVMLKAVAQLSQDFSISCQLSLEEHMACAVGGCAGCTVETINDAGIHQMKRVCVDGPIFDAKAVFP
ncbi:MAG: dihydroorotate dehydrogenase electron transfer subunit [Gammaproteobacteria bacterium]